MSERGESLDPSWKFEIAESTGFLHIPSLGLHTPNYCLDEHHTSENNSSSFVSSSNRTIKPLQHF